MFVHGNPGSSADWEPLLAAVGPDRRAVAWDAPGFGQAAKDDAFPQTVPAHAAFIGAALTALGMSARTSSCTTSAAHGASNGRPQSPTGSRA